MYKLTGPALLKQDVGDAKTNVDGRITMLKAEMYEWRLDVSFHLIFS